MNNKIDQHESFEGSNTDSKEITLWEVLDIVLKKRVLILLYTITVSIIVLCVTWFYYAKSPTSKVCVLNFSLMFDGISDGKYPNGTPFVDSDIASAAILKQVYDDDRLKQYFGSLGNFKRIISVQKYNPKLTFLNYEFKSKLSDKTLTSAERYDIEQEFYRQVQNMISKPDFTLVLTFPDASTYNFPDDLGAKILNDILTAWISQAKRYRGITKYNISLISNRIRKDFILNTDYFLGVDLMRLLLKDLNHDVEKLGQIPNIKLIRLKYDDRDFSIQDLKKRLSFIKRFILEPLLANINMSGITSNKHEVVSYITAQVDSLEMQADVLMRKKDNYEQMLLERYTTSLEPILKINTEEIAIKNEMKFYEKLLKVFESSDNKISPDTKKRIVAYREQLFMAENSLIDLIEKFYNEMCSFNLESNATFYKLNSYSSFVFRNISAKNLWIVAFVSWIILELLLLVPIVIFGLHWLRKGETHQYHQHREDIKLSEYIRLRTLPEKSESLDKMKELSQSSDSLSNRKKIPK